MGKTTIAKKVTSFDGPVDISNDLLSSSSPWTCPGDGYIVAYAQSTGDATGIYIYDTILQKDACAIYENTMYNNTQLTCSGPVIRGRTYYRRYFAGTGYKVLYYQFK